MSTQKVIVNLPEEMVEFLQHTAKKQSLTFTDILRRVINVEKFFVEQERIGNKILVEDEYKVLRKVIRQ